jgi:hypothetical protein
MTYAHRVNSLPDEPGPDCIICAVRQLTEGQPITWAPNEEGQEVSGIVLRVGTMPSPFSAGPVRFVDLWLGGRSRIRIAAYGASLDNAIRNAEAQVGDRLSVKFEGIGRLTKGHLAGREYKIFTTDVRRGHH